MKMLVALGVLGWIAVLFPRILRDFTFLGLATARRVLGI
jgi:hypothetical protein